MHISFVKSLHDSTIFYRGCLFSWYSVNWLRYLSNYQQKVSTKNQRVVYEWINTSDDVVYEWVRFFKSQVYERDMFWNTGSNIRTTITSKLPTPHPENERDREVREQEWKWRNRRNENIPHLPLTILICYKDSRPCPTVSQYQLDALGT